MEAIEFKQLIRETMVLMRKSAAESMDKITQSCYDLGKVTALTESGQLSRYISYSEATRPRNKGGYGRGVVDRWVSEGLLEKIKDGSGNSKVRFDRLKLAELDAQSNRASWFKFHDTDAPTQKNKSRL